MTICWPSPNAWEQINGAKTDATIWPNRIESALAASEHPRSDASSWGPHGIPASATTSTAFLLTTEPNWRILRPYMVLPSLDCWFIHPTCPSRSMPQPARCAKVQEHMPTIVASSWASGAMPPPQAGSKVATYAQIRSLLPSSRSHEWSMRSMGFIRWSAPCSQTWMGQNLVPLAWLIIC